MSRIPVGLELYSVRNEFAADPIGTLRAVKEMGYEGVEFAGPPRHGGAELKRMLDDTGLICCGWHTPYSLVQADALPGTVELNLAVGNPFVIIPGIPAELRRTRNDWLAIAEFFNSLAECLSQHGLVTGYHNHNIEFTPLDGECPWETLIAHTRQDVVMQLDLGNALHGGGDVMALLKRCPGRSRTVHLKPYAVSAGSVDPHAGFRPIIGDDDVPWEDVFRFCETDGKTEWYIVEYESDAFPPLEAVSRCLDRIRSMGR